MRVLSRINQVLVLTPLSLRSILRVIVSFHPSLGIPEGLFHVEPDGLLVIFVPYVDLIFSASFLEGFPSSSSSSYNYYYYFQYDNHVCLFPGFVSFLCFCVRCIRKYCSNNKFIFSCLHFCSNKFIFPNDAGYFYCSVYLFPYF